MKNFSLLILCLMISACGKPKAKDVPQGKAGGDVGPYDLVLSGENENKQNSFSASINQEEGAVDFFLPNGDAAQFLELTTYSAQVTGCNANDVQVTPVWYTSESSPQGVLISNGMTMMTTPRTRSLLRMVFQRMKGCTQLNFSMVVRKLNVGIPQPMVDPQLSGTWVSTTSPGLTLTLGAGSTVLTWQEVKNGSFTCSRTLYPSTAPEAMGGWIVTSGAALICKYAFLTANRTEMDVTCHGTNSFGCTVPKNFRFVRR